MRIVKKYKKEKYYVVTGYFFWKRILSAHPCKENAEYWIKNNS